MIDQELVIGVKLHSLDHISQKSPLSAHTVLKKRTIFGGDFKYCVRIQISLGRKKPDLDSKLWLPFTFEKPNYLARSFNPF